MGVLSSFLRKYLEQVSDDELRKGFDCVKDLGMGGYTYEEMFPLEGGFSPNISAVQFSSGFSTTYYTHRRDEDNQPYSAA